MVRAILGRLAIGTDTAALQLVAGAALLVVLAPVVLYLPLIQQLVIPLSILVGLAFIARPTESLIAIFGLRIVVDLLWWAEGSVAGMNVMELFSGTVSALAFLLAALNLERLQRHPFFIPALLFLGILGIGSLRSGDVRTAAEILARFVSPVVLMFLVTTFFEQRHRRWLVALIPALGIVPVLLGFWHWSNGQANELVLHGFARLSGAYSNIHNHAHAMALFSVLAIFWIRRFGASARSVALLAYVAACSTLMFLTYVRTALVGVVVFGVVFLLLERQWKLALITAGATLAAVLSSAVLQERFADVALLVAADPGQDTASVGSGRMHIWTSGMARFLDRSWFDVLFGMGLDQHKLLNEHELDAHNDYLALLFQMGPFALAIYLWFQGLVVWYGLWLGRVSRDPWVRSFAHFMVALNAMVLVVNFLSNSYINRVHVAWLFWGLCGILFAMAADEERRVASKDKKGGDPLAAP